jgi:diguanylate cyclase (GGDEF)-like protein/PAS domain S-box-containing protein
MTIADLKTLLVIEDNPGDMRLLREMLAGAGAFDAEIVHAQTMREGESALRKNPVDLILLDLGLPDAQGIEAVRRARFAAPRLPLVVLTGLDDEMVAERAMQEGAQDYLIKGQIETRALLRAIRYALERKSMEAALFRSKKQAEVTLNCIGDAVVSLDTAGRVTFVNRAAETMTGWAWRDARGRLASDVIRIVDAANRSPASDPVETANGRFRETHQGTNGILIRRDGSEMAIEDSLAPLYDRDGEAMGAVVVFRDVSVTRALAAKLVHTAQHDFLTGLPNRVFLNDRIESAIAIAPRHAKKVALMFLDLDGFKHINDSLGHSIGDKLLQSVSRRLADCVRGSDTLSRQGGDEFVVLLSEVEHAQDPAITARRMLDAVAEPHHIEHHILHVTASIGVSIFPDDGTDAETLVKNADTAMYQAKANGRQSYQFFKPAMNARAIERQSVEEHLRCALPLAEMSLHYQPKVSLKTGTIIGAEALLRWANPMLGAVAPAMFIPVAEESGLIVPIGAWVMRAACEQAKAWNRPGLPRMTMAVNVSAVEFRNEGFLAGVFRALDETGLEPGLLELELAESVLMKRGGPTAAILAALRARGVQVAIDDFGTGYSSLSYLCRFPVDALKIDQSFIREIGTSGSHTSIVAAVIGMAHNLKIRVVAEGVEDLDELAFLKQHACDEAQGHYFSQALPPEAFARLVVSGLSRGASAGRRVGGGGERARSLDGGQAQPVALEAIATQVPCCA